MSSSGDSNNKEPDQQRLLVVDDDRRLLGILKKGLSLRGYAVAGVSDSAEALDHLENQPPDLIVLDIMMPGLDGLRLCRLIRRQTLVPIIMLTARDSVQDKVLGLEAGADDYVVKPFAIDELAARVSALLRRVGGEAERRNERLSYSDLTVDPVAWAASRGQQPLPLTATEFRLLHYLITAAERVVTRDQILTAVWGDEWRSVDSNVVDVHIGNLRQKLEAGERPRLIQTVHSVGFVMKES